MNATVEELIEKVWVEEKVGEDKDTGKDKPKFGSRPPKDGPCKRCGENKPLNRLFLCYPCWVKVELEKRGWHEGEPHPAGCGCDMTTQHGSGGPQG